MKQLAEQFGISKDYMKKLLRRRNPFPVTPRIAARLRELQAQTLPPEVLKRNRPHPVMIYTKYRVPQVVHLYLQPRKCRGHNHPSIMSPNQVYCGTSKRQRAVCQKLWRIRERRNEKSHTTKKEKRK